MKKRYFDYAATTPVDPEVAKAMEPFFLNAFGNASSLHSFGQEAHNAIEHARAASALFIGADPEEIVFTSGGTESNNFVLNGVSRALREKGNHIIASAVEHHAVIDPLRFLERNGVKVSFIGVDNNGVVLIDELKKAITDKTILISIMHANNEVGTIQPLSEIGKIAREKGIYLHSDAVQTVGHIPVDVNELNVDFLSFSAHKFYGPKGSGALYIRKGCSIESYLRGGGQEKGRRASTLNTPGIMGLAKALEVCSRKMDEEARWQSALRDKMIKRLQETIPDIVLNGHPFARLPNNINISIKYVEGESVLLQLDAVGIACSIGSACTSLSLEPSHVLLALGLPDDLAHGSLRLTIGRWTKEEDADYLLEQLPRIIKTLRAASSLEERR